MDGHILLTSQECGSFLCGVHVYDWLVLQGVESLSSPLVEWLVLISYFFCLKKNKQIAVCNRDVVH